MKLSRPTLEVGRYTMNHDDHYRSDKKNMEKYDFILLPMQIFHFQQNFSTFFAPPLHTSLLKTLFSFESPNLAKT